VLSTHHARLRVQRAPGIPHALCLWGEEFTHNSGASRRENAKAYVRPPDAEQRAALAA